MKKKEKKLKRIKEIRIKIKKISNQIIKLTT